VSGHVAHLGWTDTEAIRLLSKQSGPQRRHLTSAGGKRACSRGALSASIQRQVQNGVPEFRGPSRVLPELEPGGGHRAAQGAD